MAVLRWRDSSVRRAGSDVEARRARWRRMSSVRRLTGRGTRCESGATRPSRPRWQSEHLARDGDQLSISARSAMNSGRSTASTARCCGVYHCAIACRGEAAQALRLDARHMTATARKTGARIAGPSWELSVASTQASEVVTPSTLVGLDDVSSDWMFCASWPFGPCTSS